MSCRCRPRPVSLFKAPIGVGFSYSTNAEDYLHINDTSAALDNLNALRAFFASYPEYALNDFFIAGESYAGVYIPTLAQQIILSNEQSVGTDNSIIPLKGVLIGNGCSGMRLLLLPCTCSSICVRTLLVETNSYVSVLSYEYPFCLFYCRVRGGCLLEPSLPEIPFIF